MTRSEVWREIEMAHADVRGLDVERDRIEKTIDELIKTERKAAEAPLLALIRAEADSQRFAIAERLLAILIEKHDGTRGPLADPPGPFDRALAGRAVMYADDLIRVLQKRRAP